MSTSDGTPVPPTPPNPPVPPPSGQPVPPPGQPAPGAQETRMPAVALVFGILSLVQCLPIVGGVVAIVTGIMGRRRARAIGQSTGMATAGLWLGIVGIVINIILAITLVATGILAFGVLQQQTKVAEQLKPAQVAAEAYGQQNGSYEGISLEALKEFGYVPAENFTVKPVSLDGGNNYCIQGVENGSPASMIHVPTTPNSPNVSITIGGIVYVYSTGECPVAS